MIDSGILMMTALGDAGAGKSAYPLSSLPDAGLPVAVQEWLEDRSSVSDAALINDQGQQFLCEYLVRQRFNVLLFGAGHVGRALVRALATQQCGVLWIDERVAEFPEQLPGNVTALISDETSAAIDQAPAGSFVLVMTHRHPLDFKICRQALARADLGLVGLIGSATKRRRFVKALEAEGLDHNRVARLCCPIGIDGIHGKRPEVIAASVVAQLLLLFDQGKANAVRRVGISARQAEASAIGGFF
jgi:xanthine dehydrogenase accessory factor